MVLRVERAVPETAPEIDGRKRVVVAAVRPSVDGGRYPVKRTLGETLTVEADLLIDGHDLLAARLHVRRPGAASFTELPMHKASPHHPDRWRADVAIDALGVWELRVEAWVDVFATWRHGLDKKVAAGQDVSVELMTGAQLTGVARLDATTALDPALAAQMAAHSSPPGRELAAVSPVYRVIAERERARFNAWYELFPRSLGKNGAHGTLRDVIDHLPYVKELGFDTLYLPPIHPIGRAHRKGKNNSLTAQPGEPGSPWAIGGPEGGHDALHPELGTLDDLAALVARARALDIDVGIDIAFQASPDHPWVKDHPDWFVRRPDGSIQYAENPPKKYQDVYPFNFECADWRGLWNALAGVFLAWCARGVRAFRVDNPHTKPLPFWEWCLATVRAQYPDAFFLSEAFTRPLLLEGLAKLGFSQSYTYFTWRTTARELRQYGEELVSGGRPDFLRPSFWPNTPDILPEHLQWGGRSMFMQRAILAATMTASWGIYGPAFELCESAAMPGKEEYADSEKYQLRQWNLDAPHSLRHLIGRLNKIRREHPALQQDRTLRFHPTTNDALLCYSKAVRTASGEDDVVLVVVSTDAFHTQSGWIELDLEALGIAPDTPFQVHDLIGEARWVWSGSKNYVEIDPRAMPGHVLVIHRRRHQEHGFEYFL